MKKMKLIVLISLIFVILIVTFKVWVKSNVKKEQIPVLMYHEVIKDDYYTGQPDTIKLSTFEKQLKYLKNNNYKTLTLDEFYCWKKGNCKFDKNSVVLTFDDGFYSFHYLVEPLLKKYDFHATNFLIGTTIKETTKEYNSQKYGTIGKNLILNHSKNVNYQSHSFDMHSYVNKKQKIYTMSEKELQEDVNNMKKIYDFEYISYPFNTDTDIFIKILKNNNYKLAFRGEAEKSVKSNNDFQISRIGINENFYDFRQIFETKKYNNRYGSGFIRKILITIERKLKFRLG